MHMNRTVYSLAEYQDKLVRQSKYMRLFLKNKETEEEFYFKPTIKSLWVDKFRKEYLRVRADRLRIRLNKNDLNFLTLTYWTELYTQEEVAERHKKDINLFIKECRKLRKDFAYMYVVEVTKKNYVHFHLFVTVGLLENQYKKIWKSITGAWHTTLKKITYGKMAVNYVNKYVNKIVGENSSQLEFMWKYIDRLFASSRNFFARSVDRGKGSLFSLIAMFFGDLDIIEQSDKFVNHCGFVDMRTFFNNLADTDKLLEFNVTDNGFTFIKNTWFRDFSEKCSYYTNVINEYDYSLEAMFNHGYRVNLF